MNFNASDYNGVFGPVPIHSTNITNTKRFNNMKGSAMKDNGDFRTFRGKQGIRSEFQYQNSSSILALQYPILWGLYTDKNIEYLLSNISKMWPASKPDYNSIRPVIKKVYDLYGEQNKTDSSEPERIKIGINELNKKILQMYEENANREKRLSTYYSRYMQNPMSGSIPGYGIYINAKNKEAIYSAGRSVYPLR